MVALRIFHALLAGTVRNRPAVALSHVCAGQDALSQLTPGSCRPAASGQPEVFPGQLCVLPGEPAVRCQPMPRPVSETCGRHKGAGLSTETPWCP